MKRKKEDWGAEMKDVLISIIVPTYQRDDTLKFALESLVAQTYKRFEIIVVDDNANAEWNAKVKEVIDEFVVLYPEIDLTYIVNEENCGSAQARNVGIEKAKGEYITFLDDDDIYLPEKLAKQIEFMEQGEFDYSVTDLQLHFKSGKLAEKKTHSYIEKTDSENMLLYHFMYHITGTDTMMFKSEYIREVGGFSSIDVGDEFYLMQKAIEGGGKFEYLPTCDVKALVHVSEQGVSSGDGKIRGENLLYEHKKKYFSVFPRKARRYIRMRHYAVLAFAEKRRGRNFSFFGNAIKAIFCAPIACIKLWWKR